MKRKVLILSNTEWSIYNFRSELIEKLSNDGYDVILACERQANNHFFGEDAQVHDLSLNAKAGLLAEIWNLINLFVLFRQLKPDYVLSFTIKPNIYSAFLKLFLKYKLVINITGLGKMFSESRNLFIQVIFKHLYRTAIKIADTVFYQNKSIPQILGFDPLHRKYTLLPGSGVPKTPLQKLYVNGDDTVRFVFVGRLLVNKGVKEYFLAAQIILRKFPNTIFDIYGFSEDDGFGDLSSHVIESLALQTGVNFHGPLKNPIDKLIEHDCLICPTFYNEGVPRVLLEAGSIGLVSIASKIAGCEEIITDGYNGLLCEPRNVDSLTAEIERFIEMETSQKIKLGQNAKNRTEHSFAVDIVLEEYKKVILVN